MSQNAKSAPLSYPGVGNSKINKNNQPVWRVTHLISSPDRPNMESSRVVRVALVGLFLLASLVGSIVACLTSQNVVPFVPVPPSDPVDGLWSNWSPWSKCSITCSNENQTYGTMTRIRYCNTPPPQLGGKNCSGESVETNSCFENPCPIPIDGNWNEWTEWTNCNKNCKDPGKVPMQWRNRSCDNPAPKYGGNNCIGELYHQRFCEWLPECPLDGQWGSWYIAGPCESRDKKSCALGSQRYQRKCNKPTPTSTGKECEGQKEKIEDCWFFIGCAVDLQSPLNLHVIGNGTGLFNVSWESVPYGIPAMIYRIYKTIEDETKKEIDTSYEEIKALPNKKVTSQPYWTIIDLRKYMSLNTFKILAIRMTSIDYWNEESSFTPTVRSVARSVDGKWSDWSHWSDCSTKCKNQKGHRTRTRECNNPPPSDGGKGCIGKHEEEASCIGMEEDC